MTRVRTQVESLFFRDLLNEDATYLIMDKDDKDIEAVLANNSSGLFDSTSSNEDTFEDDDYIEDDEEGDDEFDYIQ